MTNASTMIRAKTWDIAQAAHTLDRFDFVTVFVARMTRKAHNRRATNDMRVTYRANGWFYGFARIGDSNATAMDSARLYDAIRRTALNFYVQQAEELRAEILK